MGAHLHVGGVENNVTATINYCTQLQIVCITKTRASLCVQSIVFAHISLSPPLDGRRFTSITEHPAYKKERIQTVRGAQRHIS